MMKKSKHAVHRKIVKIGLFIVFAMIVVNIIVIRGFTESNEERLTKLFEIQKIAEGTLMKVFDNHGGWLGDGSSLFIYSVPLSAPNEYLENWKRLEEEKDIENIVHWFDDLLEKWGYMKYLKAPETRVKLIDRQKKAHADTKAIWQRASVNFSLALYSPSENKIIFIEIDS